MIFALVTYGGFVLFFGVLLVGYDIACAVHRHHDPLERVWRLSPAEDPELGPEWRRYVEDRHDVDELPTVEPVRKLAS